MKAFVYAEFGVEQTAVMASLVGSKLADCETVVILEDTASVLHDAHAHVLQQIEETGEPVYVGAYGTNLDFMHLIMTDLLHSNMVVFELTQIQRKLLEGYKPYNLYVLSDESEGAVTVSTGATSFDAVHVLETKDIAAVSNLFDSQVAAHPDAYLLFNLNLQMPLVREAQDYVRANELPVIMVHALPKEDEAWLAV